MNKLNKILVPVDFSEESARALQYALSLACKTSAEVVALHVVEKTDDAEFLISSVVVLEGSPFPVNDFSRVPVDILLRERSLDLWNFVERIVGANNRVKISKRIKLGNWLKATRAVIQKEDIDLVVLELRKGSFPDLEALKVIRLIRSIPCPVLLDTQTAEPTHERGKRLFWFQPAIAEAKA